MTSLLLLLLAVLAMAALALLFALLRRASKPGEAGESRLRRVGDGLRRFQENLRKYAVMDRALLDATPDETLLEAVLCNLWSKMREDQGDAEAVLAGLSQGRRMIYALYAVTGALKQDGAKGLLRGKESAFVPMALEGLDSLGARTAADRLREVAANGAAPYLEAFDAEDVKARMITYIRNQPEAFLD